MSCYGNLFVEYCQCVNMRRIGSGGVLKCYVCDGNIRKSNAKRHGRTIHNLDGLALKNFTKTCERETWRQRRELRNGPGSETDSEGEGTGPGGVGQEAGGDGQDSEVDQDDPLPGGHGPVTETCDSEGRGASTAALVRQIDGLKRSVDELRSVVQTLISDERPRGATGTEEPETDGDSGGRGASTALFGQMGELKRSVDELRSVVQTLVSDARPSGATETEEPEEADTDGGGKFDWLRLEKSDSGERARCDTCAKFGKRGGGKKSEL